MWSTYINAVSTDRVLEILGEQREKARIIAGATDLWLEMERGVHTGIETLIDITRIHGLDDIHVDEKIMFILDVYLPITSVLLQKSFVNMDFPWR